MNTGSASPEVGSAPAGAAPPPATARAWMFRTDLEWIREQLGDAAFTEFLAELPAEVRALCPPRPMPDRISVGVGSTVVRAASRRLGRPAAEVYREIGRHQGLTLDHTGMKYLIRLGMLRQVFDHIDRLWGFYLDRGRLRVSVNGPFHKCLRVDGFQAPDPDWCERLGGFAGGIGEVMGRRLKHWSHPVCTGRGGDHEWIELEFE